jgi:hypothetical protein
MLPKLSDAPRDHTVQRQLAIAAALTEWCEANNVGLAEVNPALNALLVLYRRLLKARGVTDAMSAIGGIKFGID